MTKGFNMAVVTSGLMNQASKDMAQQAFEVVNLPIDNVHPNPKNDIFRIGDIDVLTQDIDAEGLSQNFTVRPDEKHPDQYILISGHRRYEAIKKLQETDPDRYKFIPCKVETDIKNEDDEIIRIVMSNSTTREMTNAEKLAAYTALSAALKAKAARHEFYGRRRDFISEMLRMSAGQVAKLKNIDEHLSDNLKDRIKTGELSINAANKLASLSDDRQSQIADQFKQRDTAEPPKSAESTITQTTTTVQGKSGKTEKGNTPAEAPIRPSSKWDSKPWQDPDDAEGEDDKDLEDASENPENPENNGLKEECQKTVMFGKTETAKQNSDLTLAKLDCLINTYKYFKTIMIPNDYVHVPEEKVREAEADLDELDRTCKHLRNLFV